MSDIADGQLAAVRVACVHARSTSSEKIALFRSLFRGRQDIYPRRFENTKTGRKGYAPACANEWVRGICEKPRIKCGDCPHRAFLPVTDEVIRCHLSGRDPAGKDFVAGVYPMLADETCYFLAIDFDKELWQQDVLAVMETCRHLQIPAALERSRSGNGGHVWLFFTEAIPATLARKLGSLILTATMERRPELGLNSYDRFFPNQGTLPRGGFGNLIALPMQKASRENGNSLFVDDAFTPHQIRGLFYHPSPACPASGSNPLRKMRKTAVASWVCASPYLLIVNLSHGILRHPVRIANHLSWIRCGRKSKWCWPI